MVRGFEHLRDIGRPFQLADLPGYFESLGFPPGPWTTRTLQGAPMRHRGEHVGHFFLGDKVNGDAFTPGDEEILVLFASQAAAAISNARTHREVERAKAGLEALVDTSPVGVVVFEAGSGRLASVNREALRIVEAIRTPGSPPERILDVVTCRWSDGQEVSLAEPPLADLLEGAVPTRAAEVELSLPDGRSVRTLLNVSRDGELVSVVATMQDLVTVAGREVVLTATEYELLRVLSWNAGRALTYHRLLREVWNRSGARNRGLVRTYVKKLRHKLGDDADRPVYILTERAVGYRMPEPGSGP